MVGLNTGKEGRQHLRALCVLRTVKYGTYGRGHHNRQRDFVVTIGKDRGLVQNTDADGEFESGTRQESLLSLCDGPGGDSGRTGDVAF